MIATKVRITAAILLLLAIPVTADEPLSDLEITHSLEQAIERDFRLRESRIQVTTFAGSVNLRGTVPTYMDKIAAERIAKRTSGVRSVSNMLDVDAVSIDDQRVSEDILGRLERSGLIGAGDLKVQVNAGVVTLSGSIRSWEENDQAQRLAQEVRGVRQVINDLVPTAASIELADEQIVADIESVLSRDAYLAGYAIEVAVDSGRVRLSGEVPNLFHRERASEQTKSVHGVREIANDLVVVSQAILKSLPKLPSDAELQQSVDDELRVDPRVLTEGIQVVASRGVVSLVGQTDSMYSKQTAERVARRVFGVSKVVNQLQVHPSTRPDAQILADIHANLASDAILAGEDIKVDVAGGTAVLSGEVANIQLKFHALRVVSRVAGVREITNRLVVGASDSISDETIKRHIVEELRASVITRPVANQIDVTVEMGVVVLSGSVDRWVQALDAIRIARAITGVRSVENRLHRNP